MIVLCIALAALSTLLVGFVITCGVWLHSANADRLNAADVVDGQRKLVAEYKSKYEVEYAAHSVTQRELDQEKQLRGVAEAQRNEAERKTRELLTAHVKDASDDEIRAMVASAFRSPLAVVPTPGAQASDSGTNRLLRPGEEL